MKKSVVVLLLLSTLLVSCVHQNKNFADPASHEGEYTDSDIENSTSHEEEYDSSYLDIECYPSKNYGSFLVGSQDDADVLSLQLPISWILTKNDSSYVISNERGEIGKIFFGVAQDAALWKPACEEEHKTTATVSIGKIIEKRVNGSSFRHRFTFTYQSNNGDRTITLTVNYIEAASSAQNNILSKVKTKQVRTDPKIGIISAPTAKKSVLILGNSFINSSQIGNILQEMCGKNGKTCSVTAYSRGYANIGTYANDTTIINNIKSKSYGAVFICGCYDDLTEQVNHYGRLKAACDTAGIPLVLFPAHNERSDIISAIRDKYPNDIFLDWKQEINTLISKKGIDTSKFCIDDMHKHSTPLAGYVGAHMIYRAIFGELPQKYQSSYFDATSYYATLGDYVTNPSVLTETKASIY